ncbi:MAG TPA: PQQ-binding-like beta-propeller repeat protein, partial [Gemmatimonadales bacterium]|nr:PQQ-binding-like beta-propeller repeat protein [Gemmatimonadales bacterium]
EGTSANYIEGTPYIGTITRMYPGAPDHRDGLFAWDPVARKKVWEVRERFPVWSGTLVTAGGLVFYGTMDRWFRAVDAATGALQWQFRTGSGVIGQPISFAGPDGKQYIAIYDGVGGWAGAIVANNLSTTDSTGADGFVGAMQDLKQVTTAGGTLYVFALD